MSARKCGGRGPGGSSFRCIDRMCPSVRGGTGKKRAFLVPPHRPLCNSPRAKCGNGEANCQPALSSGVLPRACFRLKNALSITSAGRLSGVSRACGPDPVNPLYDLPYCACVEDGIHMARRLDHNVLAAAVGRRLLERERRAPLVHGVFRSHHPEQRRARLKGRCGPGDYRRAVGVLVAQVNVGGRSSGVPDPLVVIVEKGYQSRLSPAQPSCAPVRSRP